MHFSRILKNYTSAPIPRHVLLEILNGYTRPNDKISELIKQGELSAVKKGLYIPGDHSDLPAPEPFLIANHLRGPSYVSLETALSYWGFIPERTHETSSVTLKSSKKYSTPAGRFGYIYIAAPYYALGIRYVVLKTNQCALVASPEKALCDKIISTPQINLRSIKQTLQFLHEDLRIDLEMLQSLNGQLIENWLQLAPKRSSLSMLVNTLKSLC